ncbi:hypothetical protein [Arthrobacter caoxuetaonis]|uniref:Uncharacterized protein n=1 Tax=Arthrobacter caoxuetaonis TaxID=2886935 RepID=A0A9X1SE70_9MICC|nr:hypothetical protein [Arthrobacter caoxuetaonis]MCC3299336.1 hypothetical protein [Arthrobacter caoxuetaonis]USQ59171.1 hypothetical protein NF551_18870 [Arthrobacter caoxuetaonis]
MNRSAVLTAAREAGAGIAAILAGLFIIDVVSDPVATIMAILPMSLGTASIIDSIRTLRRAPKQDAAALPAAAETETADLSRAA